jgi:hypothetical protein
MHDRSLRHRNRPRLGHHPARVALRAGLAVGSLGPIVLLAACSGSGVSLTGNKGETLRPEAFAAAPGADAASPAATAETPTAKETPKAAPATKAASADTGAVRTVGGTPVMTIGTVPAPTAVVPASVEPARGGSAPTNLVTTAGSPPTPAPSAAPAAESVIIDSLVGQINGKPVFASEILEPLDGKLRALGESSRDANTWRRKAAESIGEELNRRIQDELVLAEARRSLTPEQRQGLFRFLRQVQESMISQRGGSEVAADEQIREGTGRSLREESQDTLDKELIRNELETRVWSRVVVSWRDVQNEYERQHDKYNPPAEYTFRMVYVPAEKADTASAVQAMIDAHQPFAEVAGSEFNEFNRREGGRIVRSVSGSQAEGEFSPVPEINEALRRLSVGQVAGPITYAPDKKKPDAKRTAWVYLEKIDQPEGVSLYDAQLELAMGLSNARKVSETERYFDRLLKRGNVSKVEIMGDRLMAIATDRYAKRFNKR